MKMAVSNPLNHILTLIGNLNSKNFKKKFAKFMLNSRQKIFQPFWKLQVFEIRT